MPRKYACLYPYKIKDFSGGLAGWEPAYIPIKLRIFRGLAGGESAYIPIKLRIFQGLAGWWRFYNSP